MTAAAPDVCAANAELSRVKGSGLASCVLLAGGLKPSPLIAASGGSVLDLSVASEQTLLDRWVSLIAPLLDHASGAAVRVIHCEATPTPKRPTGAAASRVVIHEDQNHYRGPAGVARDTCEDLDTDAHVLIAEGARLVSGGISEMFAHHAASGADITVAANPDGSPAGLYFARCAMLEIVPRRGFMDLKEQWLSRAVEKGMRVRVFSLPAPGAPPLRTRAQFLRVCLAARQGVPASPWLAHGVTRGVLVRGRVSNIIATGAEIDPGALIAHSVVMPDVRIAAGAVVARSILCPGARIGPGAEVVDAVVTASGVHHDGEGSRRVPKERTR